MRAVPIMCALLASGAVLAAEETRFGQFDRDEDGQLNRLEVTDDRYLAVNFSRLDVNGDGYLSRDESRAEVSIAGNERLED